MQGFVVKQLSEFDLNQLKKKRHTNWFLNVGAFLTWNPALILIPSAAGLGLLGYMMVSIIVTGEGLDMAALIMLTIASPILLFVLFSMIASQRRDSQYEAAVESLPALVETENSLKEWFSDHYNMKLRDGYWYMSSFEDTPGEGEGADQVLKSLARSLLENPELTRTGNIMFSVGANETPLKAKLAKQDNGEWMLIKADISSPVESPLVEQVSNS